MPDNIILSALEAATSPTTVTGMSWTPPAGTWNITWEAEVYSNGNITSSSRLYSDATPIGSVRRKSRSNNSYSTVTNAARVTTTGSET